MNGGIALRGCASAESCVGFSAANVDFDEMRLKVVLEFQPQMGI